MWSHEAEYEEGGNRREGGERNMATVGYIFGNDGFFIIHGVCIVLLK